MKRHNIFIIFIVLFLLQSCEPAATFDQPQPVNQKSLTSFPAFLQGIYLDSNNASKIIISDEMITRHYDFDYMEHKDSLASFYKIVNDTLMNMKDSSREIILLMGDSICHHYVGIDTLFSISADNILKKYKGYYFLNFRYHENAWEVKKLALQKGLLTMGNISIEEDVNKLKEITETLEDTISTQFSLSKRQFKKFVKQEGFSDQETFVRIRENGQ